MRRQRINILLARAQLVSAPQMLAVGDPVAVEPALATAAAPGDQDIAVDVLLTNVLHRKTTEDLTGLGIDQQAPLSLRHGHHRGQHLPFGGEEVPTFQMSSVELSLPCLLAGGIDADEVAVGPLLGAAARVADVTVPCRKHPVELVLTTWKVELPLQVALGGVAAELVRIDGDHTPVLREPRSARELPRERTIVDIDRTQSLVYRLGGIDGAVHDHQLAAYPVRCPDHCAVSLCSMSQVRRPDQHHGEQHRNRATQTTGA